MSSERSVSFPSIEHLRALIVRMIRAGEASAISQILKSYPLIKANESLLLECIAVEFQERIRAGQSPRPDDYCIPFPDLSTTIRQYLSTLEIETNVQDVKNSRRRDGREDGLADGPGGSTPDFQSTSDQSSRIEVDVPSLPINAGMRLGPYLLQTRIGDGGMGTVFKAIHTDMGDRVVAIKILGPRQRNGSAAEGRFRNEMKAVGAISHPNLVQAFHAGTIDGILFIAMEFVDGNDLSQIVKPGKRLSPKDVYRVVRQLALALAEVHKADLVHRDIKPSNILVDKSGNVKLADLGLARLGEGGEHFTSEGAIFGTPDYMAPEQWEDARKVDGRTDLYSLGCTMFYLLTGRAPYDEPQWKSVIAKMQAHRQVPTRDPREVKPDTAPGLCTVCMKLMAKEREQRYASAAHVVQDLDRWAKESGIELRASQVVVTNTAAGRDILLTESQTNQTADAMSPVFNGSEVDTSDEEQSATARTPQSRRLTRNRGRNKKTGRVELSRRHFLNVVIAVLAILVVGLGIGWMLQARTVVVVIQIPLDIRDPQFSFQLDGTPISSDALSGPVEVSIGEHELVVLRDGNPFKVFRFNASRDDQGSVGAVEVPQSTSDSTRPPSSSDSTLPAKRTLTILVPAYFYPAGEGRSQWDRLIEAARTTRLVIIVNPASGPGTQSDANYRQVIGNAKEAGAICLGYVATSHGKRDLTTVRGDIATWRRLYPDIGGFFIDEQASGSASLGYYQAIRNQIKDPSPTDLVVSNAGVICDRGYFSAATADVICAVEGTSGLKSFQVPPWYDVHSMAKIGGLLYGNRSEDASELVGEAITKNVQFLYMTDDSLPNPWDSLPSNFEELVAAAAESQ